MCFCLIQSLRPEVSRLRSAVDKAVSNRERYVDKFCSHLNKDISELSHEVKDIKNDAQVSLHGISISSLSMNGQLDSRTFHSWKQCYCHHLCTNYQSHWKLKRNKLILYIFQVLIWSLSMNYLLGGINIKSMIVDDYFDCYLCSIFLPFKYFFFLSAEAHDFGPNMWWRKNFELSCRIDVKTK